MVLKSRFIAAAALGAGICVGTASTHKAEALTPPTQTQQQILQAEAGGFIRHMPFCCETSEVAIGFSAIESGDGYDVTIDPKAYGTQNQPEVTLHVQKIQPWTHTDWSLTHVFSEAEIADIVKKCKEDPQETRKDTCDQPDGSLVYAAPHSPFAAPGTPGGWAIYCLVPPRPMY